MANSRKYYFITGLAAMAGLMALAVIFFKERIAFCDTAYQLVYLLIEQKPIFMTVRYAAVLSQFITLSAIWCRCPLLTIMIVHSVSTIFLFLVLYVLAFIFSRKHMLFCVIPFTLLILTNDVFYWQVSDLELGLTYLGLYTVLLFEETWEDQKWRWLLHGLAIFWIQFLHPLLFFPCVFKS